MTAILAPSAIEVREIVAEVVTSILGEDADPLAVVRLDAASTPPEDLEPHLTGFSLMAEEKVVVVGQASDWSVAQQRAVVARLRTLPAGTSVVLTVAGEQATSRTPLVSELMDFVDRTGRVVRRATQRAWKMQPWVQERAAHLGAAISPDAVEELLARVGADHDRLASELAKLAVYVGDGGEITLAAVRTLVARTAESSVFALVDALADGNTAQALHLIREYLPPTSADDAAAHLLYMLARQLRLVWQTHALAAAGYNLAKLREVPEELVGKLPADPNVVGVVSGRDWLARKLMGQAQRHSEGGIISALSRVYAADLTLKGLLDRRLPAEAVAELLVAEMFAPRRAERRART